MDSRATSADVAAVPAKATDLIRNSTAMGLAIQTVAIMAIALGARLVHLLACVRGELLHGLFLDSAYYARIAAGIGGGEEAGDTPYLLSPLYPYWFALFPGASIEPILQVALGPRIAQAFLGALTCVFAARIAQRVGGARAGWIAGIAAALLGPLVHYDVGILVAGPQAFCLTAALALALSTRAQGAAAGSGSDETRIWRWAGVGGLLGVAAALRPTALAIAIVLAAIWLIDGLRRRSKVLVMQAAAVLAGALLVVLPFGIRNASIGEWVPLSANGGFNFWVGNHAGASGVFDPPAGYDFNRDPVGYDHAKRALDPPVGYIDASRWWRDRALADMAEDPAAWLRLVGKKALLSLHPGEIPQLGWSYGWYRARSSVLGLPVSALWVLLFALAAGMARRSSAPSLRLPFLFLFVHLATLALFFVTGRFRAPILPIAIALAAVTLDGVIARLAVAETRVRGVALLVGLLAVGATGELLLTRYLPIRAEAGLEETQRGHSLAARGEHGRGLAAFEAALLSGETASALSGAAESLRHLGRSEEAAAHYRRILAHDPANALAWFNLGTLSFEDLRQADEAERSLRRALALRPDMADARFNLGAVLLQVGRFEEARGTLERALADAPRDAAWRGEAQRALAIARARSGS